MTAAILFDFNGVIVDDEPQHCDALIATLAEYGYHARPGHLLSRVPRLRRPRVLPLHLRPHGTGGGRARAAGGDRAEERPLRARHPRARCGSCPAPTEFIETAALDGFQLAIVSGALRREIELVLDLAGLAPALRRDRRGGGRERLQARSAGIQPGARRAGARRRTAAWWSRIRSPGSPPPAPPGSAAPCSPLRTAKTACAGADLVWPDFTGHAPAELPWAHA